MTCIRDAAVFLAFSVRQHPTPFLGVLAVVIGVERSSAKTAVSIVLIIFYRCNSKFEGTKLQTFFQILLLFEK
jgi:hypothetical protein